MKSVKPILLFSFLLFAGVFASDFDEHIVNNNELADYNDSDDLDLSDDEDFAADDEDIIYSGMISAKPPPTPPPVNRLPSSSSLVKTPTAPPTTPPPCKKWRCKMNGYTPIWTSKVSSYCKDNYAKLGIMAKASCQDQFCEKVCEKF